MPQHNVCLSSLVYHGIQGKVFLGCDSVLTECPHTAEYLHSFFSPSPSAPLDQVNDIDMGVSNDLGNGNVLAAGDHGDKSIENIPPRMHQ